MNAEWNLNKRIQPNASQFCNQENASNAANH